MFKAVQKKLFVVSIPNGMEFYTKTALGNLRSASFNSQRDGILHFKARYGKEITKCFNSQRDGILPTTFLKLLPCLMFQFPTGWNSTLLRILCRSIRTVSIPNGMEFYKVENPWVLVIDTFQFPTGWNSTKKDFGL